MVGEGSDDEAMRCWDDLVPDALAVILGKVGLEEKLSVVPRVCKLWRRAVAGPMCWQEVDIEEWCHRSHPEQVERMVKMLVSRGGAALCNLSVSRLQDDAIFAFIVQHGGGSLRTLKLPVSEVSDAVVEEMASKLSSLTTLDISYCSKMGCKALEAIGRNCKSLVGLSRNMNPIGWEAHTGNDEEAMAIATTMPRLKHLEMFYGQLTETGLRAIYAGCQELEHLDVRGCHNLRIGGAVTDRRPGLRVLGPLIPNCYDSYLEDDCSDDYDSSSIYSEDGELDEEWDGVDEWDEGWDGVEMRVYLAAHNPDHDFGWPASP
ncbi:hypothetical protein AMTRI_Chr04g183880 [Amborella trichopoda]|uniref:F-box domain-containing protein n=1 Tax=Amborella trichopoda TaxID=13333 RepID=W1NQT1_AMBTC|nr:F-box protein FBW2 [Amborella trichopoda]ERM97330.1 hypothetical protein AMTR_s00073p00116690 [Amborella trichopoda]|eukprot:XP_006829914.1 F-box protein FBW2 [Amborella trichopoda]